MSGLGTYAAYYVGMLLIVLALLFLWGDSNRQNRALIKIIREREDRIAELEVERDKAEAEAAAANATLEESTEGAGLYEDLEDLVDGAKDDLKHAVDLMRRGFASDARHEIERVMEALP